MTEVTPLVIALLCMLGQATGQRPSFCGVDSRPHPKGLCGSRLIRARDNLCFLLSVQYPSLFGRSANKRSLANIDDYPVEVFADMILPAQSKFDGEEHLTGTPVTTENMRKLFLSLFPKVQALLPEMGMSQLPQAPGAKSGRLQAKRANDVLPHVQKRGMVCECCFNVCQASTLAQYCSF